MSINCVCWPSSADSVALCVPLCSNCLVKFLPLSCHALHCLAPPGEFDERTRLLVSRKVCFSLVTWQVLCLAYLTTIELLVALIAQGATGHSSSAGHGGQQDFAIGVVASVASHCSLARTADAASLESHHGALGDAVTPKVLCIMEVTAVCRCQAPLASQCLLLPAALPHTVLHLARTNVSCFVWLVIHG
jgi:hypothetical protein